MLDSGQTEGLTAVADHIRGLLVDESERGRSQGTLEERLGRLIDREVPLIAAQERDELRRLVEQMSFGLGPLEPLLEDPEVSEIMVNGPGAVWVERHGRIEPTEVVFESEQALRHAIERILAPLGRRVDEAEPLVDARLADGSRVNVIIPPLALNGPTLTVRRFRRRGFTPDQLVGCGTLTVELRDFLERSVKARLNLLITGGTGSGKTTTLNALSSFIDRGERIVTIEDAAELALQQPHVIRLESRPPNMEGTGEVTIRKLVRNALRMRPDRIVVGEVRGSEALDMLSAMCTGHDGSLSTVHAGSPEEAMRRVETLALMADVGLPHLAIREQICTAIDLVIHQDRLADGARKVTAVSEVERSPDGPATRPLFVLDGGVVVACARPSESLCRRMEAIG